LHWGQPAITKDTIPRVRVMVRLSVMVGDSGSSGINCIGADANISASALDTADVPATCSCHQTQWRPAESHMAVNYL